MLLALYAAPAHADSGSVTNIHQVGTHGSHEATFSATRDNCIPQNCRWFPSATQVPAAEPCSRDGRLAWVGESETGPTTQTKVERFSAPSVGDFRLCVYIYADGNYRLVGEATYTWRPVPRVQVSNDARLEWTVFDVGADAGERADIYIAYRGRVIQRIVRTGIGGMFFDNGYYNWSCRRLGTHTWAVVLTHEDGSQTSTIGRFRVPGRCGPWRWTFLTAGFASNTAARGWSPEFVSRVRCRPRGARRGPRATAWACTVTHNNSFRICETFELIRKRERSRFGQRETRLIEHVGRSRCRSF